MKITLTPNELISYANTFKALSERLETFAKIAKKQKNRVDKVTAEDPDEPYGFGSTLLELKDVFDSISDDFSEDLDWTVNCQ